MVDGPAPPEPAPDPAVAGIVAYNMVARQRSDAAMAVAAAERCAFMTDDELTLAHRAASAFCRVAGSALAQRQR